MILFVFHFADFNLFLPNHPFLYPPKASGIIEMEHWTKMDYYTSMIQLILAKTTQPSETPRKTYGNMALQLVNSFRLCRNIQDSLSIPPDNIRKPLGFTAHINRSPYIPVFSPYTETYWPSRAIHEYFRQRKIFKVKEEKEKFCLFGIYFCKFKINFEERVMHVIAL